MDADHLELMHYLAPLVVFGVPLLIGDREAAISSTK